MQLPAGTNWWRDCTVLATIGCIRCNMRKWRRRPDLQALALQLRRDEKLSNRAIHRRLERSVNLSTISRWLADEPLVVVRRDAPPAEVKARWSTLSTEERGKIAELYVELRAAEKKIVLSRPTISAKYDFVVDDGSTLTRAQVKYADGRHKGSRGSVVAQLSRRGKLLYDKDSVDCLLIFVPIVGQVVRVPIDLCLGKARLVIRYAKPNNQHRSPRSLITDDYLW